MSFMPRFIQHFILFLFLLIDQHSFPAVLMHYTYSSYNKIFAKFFELYNIRSGAVLFLFKNYFYPHLSSLLGVVKVCHTNSR